MASTGLEGPLPLNEASIDHNVSSRIGAYALGRVRNDTFYIAYVGRSDKNLNKRLKEHVGDYESFKYGYFNTVKEAFEKECRLYHDFNPATLDNDVHPKRPNGIYYSCPVAGCSN